MLKLLNFIRIIGKPNDASSRRAPAGYNACPMMLTDKEEFNALVQLTAAIITRPDHTDAPPDLRRDAVVNEAHELLKRIAGKVAQSETENL